jgi:WD40 repeat protein
MTEEPSTLETPVEPARRRMTMTRRGWLVVLALSLFAIVGAALAALFWRSSREPLMTLYGHHDKVHAVAYSPDGQLLASGGSDNKARLWNAVTSEPSGELDHAGPVLGLDFSPSGDLLATIDSDRTVKLWNVADRTLRSTLRNRRQPLLIAFSPDGKQLVCHSPKANALTLFDVESASAVHLRDPQEALSWLVPQSPDGKWAARPTAGRQISITAGVAGPERHKLAGHSDKLNWVTFSPDGRRLASGGGYTFDTYTFRGGEVRLWDVESGRMLTSIEGLKSAVTCLDFSPDGRRLAAASFDGTVSVWDVEPLLDGKH